MSAETILAGFIFGAVGGAAGGYGKKQGGWRPMLVGGPLMVYPYIVSGAALTFSIGAALTALLFIGRERSNPWDHALPAGGPEFHRSETQTAEDAACAEKENERSLFRISAVLLPPSVPSASSVVPHSSSVSLAPFL